MLRAVENAHVLLGFLGSPPPLGWCKGKAPMARDTQNFYHRRHITNNQHLPPRLRNLEIPGFLLPSFIHPPLGQLGCIGYVNLNASDILGALEPISRMAPETELRLGFFLTEPIGILALPPTSSNVCPLSMELADFLGGEDLTEIVECVFANLTLPHLRELSFRPESFPSSQAYWPHTAFLDLAARSSFNNQLWSLHLTDVVITDTELIACLLALPVLEALSISDHLLSQWDDNESSDVDPFEYEFEHHLITDALLTRLTLKPNFSPIVPRLRILELRTLLQFDHTVFLEFLVSRRVEQPSALIPLLLDMYFPSGRDLELAVAERVRELRIRKEVTVLLTGVKEEGFKFYQY
ncbi:hypothetical protein MSAN_00912800 [Mycena sanguinolenta]|uniref:Uncharacterized protein n=1 Tax=Mycena sanguinolenta TaxID=230812 RepID=A0A8H6YWL8_9AGAR|nr:hypothetical protein MSAN_00912800 [Mycena sanguinolenta]